MMIRGSPKEPGPPLRQSQVTETHITHLSGVHNTCHDQGPRQTSLLALPWPKQGK
jgi:hypothetical protein